MAKLVNAAKKFDDTYTLGVEDKAALAAYDSASVARREFEADLRKLMVYVEVMMDANDPKWVTLCQKIEAFNIKFEQNEAKTKNEANKEDAPKA